MDTVNAASLSRRQFAARCAAFGIVVTRRECAACGAAKRTGSCRHHGHGSADRGADREVDKRRHQPRRSDKAPGTSDRAGIRQPFEEEAVRAGISLGMTLLDTSGNYGQGRSEHFLSHVIAGQRDRIFLVSKVEAGEVSGDGIARACEASLARLGTDHLDLYLLHSPTPSTEFSGVVATFEQLRAAGKIRAWGVSNFNMGQMEDLFRVPDGHRCATNQVAYSLVNRRIERDVLPWCARHNVPVMAYSPLGGDNHLVVGDSALAQIAATHECSAAAVALAWVIRGGNVIAIPESGSPVHVKENAGALSLALTPQDLQTLAAAYPP